ncbi:hypothetical protein D1007_59155 [Hordeum vulgare]|nr:hypothetical protein D1007_59155 [Hordeum vulgare]
MKDPPHHQGNLSLKGFTKRWAAHHKAEEPNLFIGYALSHKASFKKATPYDPYDTSSAYTSQTSQTSQLTKVREVATKLRGADYDVASEPLDHELVMIAGEGKKHGKEAIAGDMFPRFIVPSMVCPLSIFLALLRVLRIHRPMDRIMLDLHMLMLLAITLMVLRIFEICYG